MVYKKLKLCPVSIFDEKHLDLRTISKKSLVPKSINYFRASFRKISLWLHIECVFCANGDLCVFSVCLDWCVSVW